MAIQERRSEQQLAFVRMWLILTAMITVALILQILACAIYSTLWPLLSAVLYIFVPMPYLFFGASSDSVFNDATSIWSDCGKFLTGFSAVGLVALPVCLRQSGDIGTGSLVLELLSAVMLFVSVLYYDYHSTQGYYF